MSSVEVGERVGAILSGNATEVQFLGYGVRLEDEVPPDDVGGFNLGIPNPCLLLDNGEKVYGCEVWWGSEELIAEVIRDKTVIPVGLSDLRGEEQ